MLIETLLTDKKIKITIAILITVGIAILSLIKLGAPPIQVKNGDKIQHCIAYFTLSFAWMYALVTNKRSLIVIVILCVFYGIIIEVLQMTMTEYRSGELLDVFANTLGVLLALAIFRSVFYKKRSI